MISSKLRAYGVHIKTLKLLFSYLMNRKQRVKVNESFSEWVKIIIGVPQGSVFGPLLFNIFINDLFLATEDDDLCNFADDNTLYKCCKSVDEAKQKIESQCNLIIRWFVDNSMKMNAKKCHAIVLSKDPIKDNFTVSIDDTSIIPEEEVSLVGVTLDNNLNFNSHMSKICEEASKGINALLRIAKYFKDSQKNMILNSFFYSHFNYCPLIWIFSSKEANSKIEKLHKKALQIIHNDYDSTLDYHDLLLKAKSVTIHKRNLQFLMTEIFKTLHDTNLSFMKEIFVREDTRYNLKCVDRLNVPRVNSKTYRPESLSFRGSQLWNLLPNEFKTVSSLSTFKDKIKSWNGSNCNCKVCWI